MLKKVGLVVPSGACLPPACGRQGRQGRQARNDNRRRQALRRRLRVAPQVQHGSGRGRSPFNCHSEELRPSPLSSRPRPFCVYDSPLIRARVRWRYLHPERRWTRTGFGCHPERNLPAVGRRRISIGNADPSTPLRSARDDSGEGRGRNGLLQAFFNKLLDHLGLALEPAACASVTGGSAHAV